MKNSKYNNFEDYIRKFQQHVNRVLFVPFLAFIILFIRIENGHFHPLITDSEILNNFRYAAGFFNLLIDVAGLLYFNFQLKKARLLPGLRDKLNLYYGASLLKDYLIILILILNLFGMGLTGEKYYTGFFGISLIVLLMGYPAHMKIVSALKLNPADSDIILNKGIIE